ncbi:MAG: argininosuccinate synthase, partial [Promethearchaeota archaeon]
MQKLNLEENSIDKILLLYSGGLLNNQDYFKKVEEKAYELGVVKHYLLDLKEKFVNDYVFKVIKANGLYQGIYPLTTAIGRPLIAIEAVKIAKKENINVIAHGCTGKGNDQIRFNITIEAMAPDIQIIQPLIEWNMGRDDELIYAEKYGIPIPNENKKYSIDTNLFGRSIECDVLEYPEIEPPRDAFTWTNPLEKCPDVPQKLVINFEKGLPVGIDNVKMKGVELIEKLNEIGSKHGVGRLDHVEDRCIGLKSREIYEAPAAKHENSFKSLVDQRWIELVYDGLWVDPLRDALEAFINEVNKKVTGSVFLKLFKEKISIIGRESPNGIYDLNLSTYDTNSNFDQRLSRGFIQLWGLQSRMGYTIKKKL